MKQDKKTDAMRDLPGKTEAYVKEKHKFPYLAVVFSLVLLYFLAKNSFLGGLAQTIPLIDMESVPSRASLAVLIALLVTNVIARAFRRNGSNVVSQQFLIVCYNMVTVGGLVLTCGLFWWIFFTLMGFQRMLWILELNPQILNPVFQSFSSWVLPKSQQVALDFWIGVGTPTVPWGEWLRPILLWSVFFTVAYFLLLCIANLVVRYWNDVEHLNYPIAVLIEEMTDIDNVEKKTCSFWRNSYAWIGMIISALFVGVNWLSRYFAVVPTIPTSFSIAPLMHWLGDIWFVVSGTHPMAFSHPAGVMYLSPISVGIGYLMSADVAFSIWFMVTIMFIVRIVALFVFGNSPETIHMLRPSAMTMGGYIGLALYCLWLARRDVAEVFKLAMGRNASREERENPAMNSRVSAIGLILCILFMIVFGSVFLNANPAVTALVVILYITTALGAARIRAESGIPMTVTAGQHWEFDVVLRSLGLDTVGDSTAASFHFYQPLSYGRMGGMMASAVDAYKMGDHACIKRKYITYILLVAFVVSIIFGWTIGLPVAYNYGGGKLHSFYQNFGADMGNRIVVHRQEFMTGDVGTIIAIIIAMFITYVLTRLRTLYYWWPINPIGFVMSQNPFIVFVWPGFFVAWLIKVLVLRFAGHEVMKKIRPLFIGLVVGTAGVEAIFAVIGLIIGY